MTRTTGSRWGGVEDLQALWAQAQASGSDVALNLASVRDDNAGYTGSVYLDWLVPMAGPGSLIGTAPTDLPFPSLTWSEGAEASAVHDNSRSFSAPVWRGLVVGMRGESPRLTGAIPAIGAGAAERCLMKAWITRGRPANNYRSVPVLTAATYADWLAAQTNATPIQAINTRIPWRAHSASVTVTRTNGYVPNAPFVVILDPSGTSTYARIPCAPNVPTRFAIPPEGLFWYIEDALAPTIGGFVQATIEELV